ncbi:MAG: hypothetical protein LBP51_07960, partial [Deferribacteraceae bacterium]|nr:hypothetical protein [Deferribacteraceae bacterium]
MKKVFYLSILLSIFAAFNLSTAQAREGKMRLGLYLGGYFPTEDIANNGQSINYSLGGQFGFEFTYFFSENLGIGLYHEALANSTKSSKGYNIYNGLDQKFWIASSIFGGSLTFKQVISEGSKLSLFGAARLGAALHQIHVEEQSSQGKKTLSDDDVTPAFTMEGGFLFKPNRWDFGFTLRYTLIPSIDSDFDELNAGYSRYKANLSGLSILFNAG